MQWRSECFSRFGSILNLPLRTPGEELEARVDSGTSVLDVGAGAHKPFRKTILAASGTYFTMDTDPEGSFDFRSFADVPGEAVFGLVLMNQILEHLTVDAAASMVSAAFRHLSCGGHLIATVPNAAHPVRQRDCTHITPWPANDLYSLLRSAGFEILALARYNKLPLTANPIKRWIVHTVCTEFRMDWCDSIMIVGKKAD
ncbi:MAG TPA: methyltransferase domain-containing protein [Desulfomonilaceae bacterium]|nr:methyltransferase domain-containing protein [Desulfomonilaceae bacterium]